MILDQFRYQSVVDGVGVSGHGVERTEFGSLPIRSGGHNQRSAPVQVCQCLYPTDRRLQSKRSVRSRVGYERSVLRVCSTSIDSD